jgi:hypothetical protein
VNVIIINQDIGGGTENVVKSQTKYESRTNIAVGSSLVE